MSMTDENGDDLKRARSKMEVTRTYLAVVQIVVTLVTLIVVIIFK